MKFWKTVRNSFGLRRKKLQQNEDLELQSFNKEWSTLFKHPGYKNIGEEILLKLVEKDVANIANYKTVCQSWRLILDNASFWIKVWRKQNVCEHDLENWRTLIRQIEDPKLEVNVSLLLQKMYFRKLCWISVLNFPMYGYLDRLTVYLFPKTHAQEWKKRFHEKLTFPTFHKHWHKAIPKNMLEIIRYCALHEFQSPLHAVARFGDVELMKVMTNAGLNKFVNKILNNETLKLWMPMPIANDYIQDDPKLDEILKSLIPNEVSGPHVKNELNDVTWVLLQLATMNGHYRIAKMLLPHVPINRLKTRNNRSCGHRHSFRVRKLESKITAENTEQFVYYFFKFVMDSAFSPDISEESMSIYGAYF